MINWRDICKLKSAGGLGFKSLVMMNRALHMKLAGVSSPLLTVFGFRFLLLSMGLILIIRPLCFIPAMVPICGNPLVVFGMRSWQVDVGVWVMVSPFSFGGTFR